MKATINPSISDCKKCMELAEMFNALPECNPCAKAKEVEVLQFTSNFWGSHAIVMDDNGTVETIPTRRIKVDLGLEKGAEQDGED